ncbi:MAG: hypothetical protein VKJ85_11140 [Prochlorothrix sp.]|nr:hypothetical protein [Prochlorothrix sp.]
MRLPTGALLSTFEGVAAVDEAIEFLQTVEPVPPVTWFLGLGQAALDQVDAQGETGTVGHGGIRGGMREPTRPYRGEIWICVGSRL